MENLVIESGIKEYDLNGKVKVCFNPTDMVFTERLFTSFSELDKKQSYYREKWSKTPDKKEIFDLARQMDAEMRSIIDDVLGDGVCDGLFGDMNVYAMAGGLPVWANLMLAIMDEIDTTYAKEQKLTNAKIKKYTDKYHK